ncbi:hypothetical protein ACOSQ3_027369 [Xanthoceras sorbifolium]
MLNYAECAFQGLWGNRNARFHRLKVRDVDQLIAWVSGLLAEFQSSISLLVPLGQPFLQVIRNSDGWVVAAFAKPLKCCDSAKVGEFLGLREGLVVAKQLGLPVALTEVDASSVVDGVNLLKPSLSVVGSSNSLAHNLASLALSSGRDFLWQDICPSIMLSL